MKSSLLSRLSYLDRVGSKFSRGKFLGIGEAQQCAQIPQLSGVWGQTGW